MSKIMKTKKPIEKYLGMKCVSCKNFIHKDFTDLQSRLNYGWRTHGGYTFGRCVALDCEDAVGCHLVIHESSNPDCHFISAGDV